MEYDADYYRCGPEHEPGPHACPHCDRPMVWNNTDCEEWLCVHCLHVHDALVTYLLRRYIEQQIQDKTPHYSEELRAEVVNAALQALLDSAEMETGLRLPINANKGE